LVATQQLLCRIDGIEVGKIDGIVGTQTRYAFSVYDARLVKGGVPDLRCHVLRLDEGLSPQMIFGPPLN
jgi:hypothetical protein